MSEKYMRRVLLFSVCGILVCMGCLVSTTWAWFSVTVSNEANVIQMGNFVPVVTVTDPLGQELQTDQDGGYPLESGIYTVTIINEGDVKGYCRVLIGVKTYHITVGTAQDSAFTFTLTVPAAEGKTVSLSVWGFWGTPAENDNEILAAGISAEAAE